MDAQVIKTSLLPPRDTKWAALENLLAVLRPDHSIVFKIKDTQTDYQRARGAVYAMAKRLRISISIRKHPGNKLSVTRIEQKG